MKFTEEKELLENGFEIINVYKHDEYITYEFKNGVVKIGLTYEVKGNDPALVLTSVMSDDRIDDIDIKSAIKMANIVNKEQNTFRFTKDGEPIKIGDKLMCNDWKGTVQEVTELKVVSELGNSLELSMFKDEDITKL